MSPIGIALACLAPLWAVSEPIFDEPIFNQKGECLCETRSRLERIDELEAEHAALTERLAELERALARLAERGEHVSNTDSGAGYASNLARWWAVFDEAGCRSCTDCTQCRAEGRCANCVDCGDPNCGSETAARGSVEDRAPRLGSWIEIEHEYEVELELRVRIPARRARGLTAPRSRPGPPREASPPAEPSEEELKRIKKDRISLF